MSRRTIKAPTYSAEEWRRISGDRNWQPPPKQPLPELSAADKALATIQAGIAKPADGNRFNPAYMRASPLKTAIQDNLNAIQRSKPR